MRTASIYGLPIVFPWSSCLFAHQLHIIHAPCSPGPTWWSPFWSPLPLKADTAPLQPPPQTHALSPSANSQGCLSRPSQHHSPTLSSWTRHGPCLWPSAAPLLPPLHPALVYSSLAPWRDAFCLISDCGPAWFPNDCKPATSLPSTFCHYREIWAPALDGELIFQLSSP